MRRWGPVVLLAVACGRSDSETTHQRAALDAWRLGVEALPHDPDLAAGRFREALVERPEDAVLWMWHAKALADSGDLEAAREAVELALRYDPNLGEARYNRAAYAARAGDIDAAAADLALAIELGVRSAAEVVLDPDFAPYLQDARFHFLPLDPLQVSVEAPDGLLFWGSEFTVRLRVVGALDAPLSVTAEQVDGPAQLLRVVEDTSPSTSGDLRDLAYTFRVTGEGLVVLGPLHLWSGSRRVVLDPIRITTAAPPDRAAGPPSLLREMVSPRELLAAHHAPSVWRVADELRVLHAPSDRVRVDPALQTATWELRHHGEVLWQMERVVVGPTRATVWIGETPYVVEPVLDEH